VRDNRAVTHPETLDQTAPLNPTFVADVVRRALDEDLGGDPGVDVTTLATIDSRTQVRGAVVARQAGVIAGVDVIAATVQQVAMRCAVPTPEVTVLVGDGTEVAAGTTVARIVGAGHAVLIAERTILNLMSRACGVATHTRRWVEALAGTGARVLDTRKTTPTLRELDKYAVRCGGGTNKRFGLYDVAMVKDNHIVAAGSVAAAIGAIRERFPEVEVQVEVESEQQAFAALDAGATFLMLDNLSVAEMTPLVASIRAAQPRYGRVWIEATGGLALDNAREVALSGVDFMSVGALTHSSAILDLGLDLD